MKKFISALLICTLASLTFSPIYAYEMPFKSSSTDSIESIDEEILLETSDYRLTFEYDSINQVTFIAGYDNYDNLLSKYAIYDNNKENIYVITTTSDEPSILSTQKQYRNFSENIIKTSDIVTSLNYSNDIIPSLQSLNTSSSTREYLGKLKIILKGTNQSFNFNVSQEVTNTRYSQFTIDKYKGDIALLVAGCIGTLSLPAFISKNVVKYFLINALTSLGVTLKLNQITTPYTDTVDALVSDIYMVTSDFANKRIKTGEQGYIVSLNSNKRSTICYNGTTKKDWGNDKIPKAIINAVFGWNYASDYTYKYL